MVTWQVKTNSAWLQTSWNIVHKLYKLSMVLFWHTHSLHGQQKFHRRKKMLFFAWTVPFKIFMHSLPLEKKHSNLSSHNSPLVWNTAHRWQEVVTWLPSLKANEWVYQNRCLPAVSRGPNASARLFSESSMWSCIKAAGGGKWLEIFNGVVLWAGVCRGCLVYGYDQLLKSWGSQRCCSEASVILHY